MISPRQFAGSLPQGISCGACAVPHYLPPSSSADASLRYLTSTYRGNFIGGHRGADLRHALLSSTHTTHPTRRLASPLTSSNSSSMLHSAYRHVIDDVPELPSLKSPTHPCSPLPPQRDFMPLPQAPPSQLPHPPSPPTRALPPRRRPLHPKPQNTCPRFVDAAAAFTLTHILPYSPLSRLPNTRAHRAKITAQHPSNKDTKAQSSRSGCDSKLNPPNTRHSAVTRLCFHFPPSPSSAAHPESLPPAHPRYDLPSPTPRRRIRSRRTVIFLPFRPRPRSHTTSTLASARCSKPQAAPTDSPPRRRSQSRRRSRRVPTYKKEKIWNNPTLASSPLRPLPALAARSTESAATSPTPTRRRTLVHPLSAFTRNLNPTKLSLQSLHSAPRRRRPR
ncbi:hypothetical protein R3P38DRAFT_3170469 [Favolaschia claudopus]|uniref:Uncharacterized protein n=1 Tax=Favolaschia claudopus TaxID=2862362 RepID=A0AAW0DX92_9AGAR